MPSIIYRGDFGEVGAGSSGIGATAKSDDAAVLPDNAEILSITYSLAVSSTKYAKDYDWVLYWLRVGENSLEVTDVTAQMVSGSHTFEGSFSFTQEHADLFRTDEIFVHSRAKTTHPTAGVFLKAFTIVVEYDVYKLPILNSNYPEDVAGIPGQPVTLQVVIDTPGNPAMYTYQWYRNAIPIEGATEATLTVMPEGSKLYFCAVTNTAGTVYSSVARVYIASGGAIRINGELVPAIPYVFVDGEWVSAQPYIYENGEWVVGTSA